jgi:hypothetical protein
VAGLAENDYLCFFAASPLWDNVMALESNFFATNAASGAFCQLTH